MGGKISEILTFFIVSCFLGCIKDTPTNLENGTPTGNGIVYVVCEGNYGSGNATLYAYKPTSDSTFGDLYKTTNNQHIGDVFQSMVKIGGSFFLCINNSDKILVIDTATYKLTHTISIPKPRYILPLGNNTAYVSSLYNNKVYIINTQNFSISGTISTGYFNTEGMCQVGTSAIICNWDTSCNTIQQVDINSNIVTHTMRIPGYAPQEVLLDKEQMLWVLSGDQPEGKTAVLSRLDISTGAVLDSFVFPNTVNPVKPVFNKTKDTLYFIEADYYGGLANNGIFRMDIHDHALPALPFIAAEKYQYFWALGIDPTTGYIYVGDPKGFTQNGKVGIYKQNGAMVSSFNVGLGPGHFYFDN